MAKFGIHPVWGLGSHPVDSSCTDPMLNRCSWATFILFYCHSHVVIFAGGRRIDTIGAGCSRVAMTHPQATAVLTSLSFHCCLLVATGSGVGVGACPLLRHRQRGLVASGGHVPARWEGPRRVVHQHPRQRLVHRSDGERAESVRSGGGMEG